MLFLSIFEVNDSKIVRRNLALDLQRPLESALAVNKQVVKEKEVSVL